MDSNWARRKILVAVAGCSTEWEKLALKGGNALALVHELGVRTTLDLDYSIEEDFEDYSSFAKRLEAQLTEVFGRYGVVVFSFDFATRPRVIRDKDHKWGGYLAKFKLIRSSDWEATGEDVEKADRLALRVAPGGQASTLFKVEISKHEYCGDLVEREIEGTTIPVYSLALIAVEKLRALCQQHPDYPHRSKPAARPQDFVDLVTLIQEGAVNLGSGVNRDLLRAVFHAKDVDLILLPRIADCRTFHEDQWEATRSSLAAEAAQDFAYYFDFVMREVSRLETLWNM